MNLQGLNWVAVSPEAWLLTAICIVLVVDLFLDTSMRWVTYAMTQVALVITALAVWGTSVDAQVLAFDNSFVRDPMGDVLKIGLLLVSMGVFLYARDYLKLNDMIRGEFYTLRLFAVLGMMIMVSGYSFLTLYLGLELLSLAMYALVAFSRDDAAGAEAAMKYFVLGAIASGLLLYGMSIVYGLTGSLNIGQVQAHLLGSQGDMSVAAIFGLVFVVVGVAFKLGLVPFHMWVPDVYHGAPVPVTLLVSSAPKIAAFALAMRLLAEGFAGQLASWQDMLVILAVLSIGLGNVIAIAQTNIRRMLAYSAISHVGFITLGILAGTQEGYSAAMFYTLLYALMSLGTFGLIVVLGGMGRRVEAITDLSGLARQHPWLALMMMLLLLSMAGVPPTAGFYAKLAVIESVVRIDMVWLAVYAVVLSVVGAYYYLRVLKVLYFDEPEGQSVGEPAIDVGAIISFNGLLMILLGVMPGILMGICTAAFA